MVGDWNSLNENQWTETTWGKVVELKYGRALNGYKETVGSNPVFGTNGHIGFCNTPLCNFASVIIGRKGAYRGVHYSNKPFWVIDTAFFIQPLIRINLKWAYYFLLTQDINGLDSGSAIPSTRREDFYALPVTIPPRKIQDKIVYLLDLFDSQITLNHQINQILEQMAQTLFKSWFVDFDPVLDNALDAGNPIPDALQAKADIRQKIRASADFKPLPSDIRELFPSDFEESELGWIPKGWEVSTFSKIANHVKKNIKSQDICHSDMYIGLEHMGRNNLFLSDFGIGANVASNKSCFEKNDLLFGKLRPYFHKIALAPSDGICSTDILIFKAKTNYLHSFMTLTVNTKEFVEYANLRSTGTRMPRANAKDILACLIIIPQLNILKAFEKIVSVYWDIGYLGVHQNLQLTKLRDTLLPKLLSGEIQISTKE